MQSLFIKLTLMVESVLGQIQLEGLEKAAETSPLNGALVGFIILLIAGVIILFKQNDTGRKDLKELNKEHAKKLDENKKEYIDKFEKLQHEYLSREEDRNKQWSESEKETLQVLNGVTSILSMSEKMGQKDTKEILDKLKLVEERIITAIKLKN
jgi:hypothetical protein